MSVKFKLHANYSEGTKPAIGDTLWRDERWWGDVVKIEDKYITARFRGEHGKYIIAYLNHDLEVLDEPKAHDMEAKY